MKNTYRGFIVPLLLVIIALMLVGGGAYVYTQKKVASPTTSGNIELPQATSTETAVNNNPVVTTKTTTKSAPVVLSVSPVSGQAPLTVTATFLFGLCDGYGYYLKWGDGTYKSVASNSYGAACNPVPPATMVSQTHTYAQPGTYSVSLYGEDFGKNAESTQTATVAVSELSSAPVIKSISRSSGPIGTEVTMYGSFPMGTWINLDGSVIGQTVIDRSSFTLVVPGSVGGTYSSNGDRTPTTQVVPGTHTISVTDHYGNGSNSVEFTVTTR